MSERCQAKDPSKCRNHGAGRAANIIDQNVDNGKIQNYALFNVAKVKEAAQNFSPENLATGMVVEYEDGTNEVFYGAATDPYHATDYSFTSASNYTVITGYSYPESDGGGSDHASFGPQKVKDVQAEMNDQLVNSYPILADGPDTETGTKKVVKVTVV